MECNFTVFSYLKMLLLCGTLFMLSAISATAQMDAMFSGGAVRVGASATTCDANASGAIRYNAADKTIEYCNETEWTAFGSGGGCGASKEIFSFTGAEQTFTVPAGCSSITVKAWGGAGRHISGFSNARRCRWLYIGNA